MDLAEDEACALKLSQPGTNTSVNWSKCRPLNRSRNCVTGPVDFAMPFGAVPNGFWSLGTISATTQQVIDEFVNAWNQASS